MLAAVPAVDSDGTTEGVPPSEDGTSSATLTKDENGNYHIKTKADLYTFAKMVNTAKGNTTGTFLLDTDITFDEDEGWTPISMWDPHFFAGVFDGQGHTIYNLQVDRPYEETKKNNGAGLFSQTQGTIQNLTISHAVITGHHYAGAIAAFMYGSIINCHVVDATITLTHASEEECGDKAGAVVGYVADEGCNSKILGCTATNCTVTAERDAGQIIGMANDGVLIGECSAVNVKVSRVADSKCTDDSAGENIRNDIVGREWKVSYAVAYIVKDDERTYLSAEDLVKLGESDVGGDLVLLFKSVVFSLIKDKVFTGSISYEGNKVSLESLKAGDKGITFAPGSITISGTITAGSNVEITASGDVKLNGVTVTTESSSGSELIVSTDGSANTTVTVIGDLTVASGVTLTVSDDAVLTVSEDAVLTVSDNATVGGSGQVVVQGTLNNSTTGSISAAVSVEEGATVTSPDTIGNIVYDDDAQYTIYVGEGSALVSTTYGAQQRIEVTGNATVPGDVTIRGVLHVNPGVTLTVAAGANLVIEGAGTSIIEGILVLEEGDDDAVADADLTVQGSAVLQIAGNLSVAGDLTVSDNASIVFKAGSSTEVGGDFSAKKAIVEADAGLTIVGAVTGGSNFEVAGTLAIESTEVSESFNVELTADGAILDIQSIAMADMGGVTVEDQGTFIIGTKTGERVGTTTAASTGTTSTTVGSIVISFASGAGYYLKDGVTDATPVSDYAVLTGLIVTVSIVKDDDYEDDADNDGKKDAKYDSKMSLSGTVAIDQQRDYTGLGTAIGSAQADITVAAGTTEVVDTLTLGPGVTLTNKGTLKVEGAIDATATANGSELKTGTAGTGFWFPAGGDSDSVRIVSAGYTNGENNMVINDALKAAGSSKVVSDAGQNVPVMFAIFEISVTENDAMSVVASVSKGTSSMLSHAFDEAASGIYVVYWSNDGNAFENVAYDVALKSNDNVLAKFTIYMGASIETTTVGAKVVNEDRISLSGQGSIAAKAEIAGISSSSFDGAYYKVGSSAVGYTHNYVTIDSALVALSQGVTDEVSLYGKQTVTTDASILSKDRITVESGAQLLIGEEAGDEVTLTVAAGGSLVVKDSSDTDAVLVNGTLTAEVYKDVAAIKGNIDSDVYSQTMNDKGKPDNSKPASWTNVKRALDNAASGETVTVNPNKDKVVVPEGTVIREGITLDANGKTIEIPKNIVLTVDGKLDVAKDGSKLSIPTLGVDAKSTDKVGSVVYDTGTIAYTEGQIDKGTGVSLPGAYYSITVKGVETKYIASYTTGASVITDADGRKVTFKADGSEKGVVITGDLAITGEKEKEVVLEIVADNLSAGKITLAYASLEVTPETVNGPVAVSATIASADGTAVLKGNSTDLKAVHGDFKIGDDAFTGLRVAGKLVTIDSTPEVKASVVFDGKAFINGALDVGDTLTVSEGSDLTVFGSADVDAKTLTVAGNLVVLAGNVDATTATISGALAAQGGEVDLKTVTVSGSIDASEKDESGEYKGEVVITTGYIGTTKAAVLGADVSLAGNVVLSATGIAYVAPAASVPSEWTAEDSTLKTTKFVDENGADYLFVYTVNENAVLIDDIKKSVTDAKFIGWTNSKGEVAAQADDSSKTPKEVKAYVGKSDWATVKAEVDYNVFTVKILTDGTISSVTLNGILMKGNGTEFETNPKVRANTYTVEFSSGAGYDTSAVKLSDSQGNAIDGFKIVVNDSTTEGREVTYQLTGGTAAAPSGGSSSGGSDFSGIIDAIDKNTEAVKNQENGGSSDSSLTDILLIVLVVLIVIMAILVAMRMMRS